jgi:hypothetical protein
VIACCGLWDSREKQLALQLDDPKAPVVCGQVGPGDKAYLYVVLEMNADIALTGRLLLDEMDRALAKTLPFRRAK